MANDESVSPIVEKVVELLQARGETVSFAESCSGGLLSSMLTARSGTSNIFNGSIVAYSNEVKCNLLGIPQTILRSMGAVSLPVAKRMAVGARAALKTTWALSITGIAGPSGGSSQKPVGTVCVGISGPGVERAEQCLFSGDRRTIQKVSSEYALQMLLLELGLSEGECEKLRA